MVNSNEFMRLEIDDVDFAFRDIHNDDLPVVEHSEGINYVFVLIFPLDFTLCIEMDYAFFLSWSIDSDADKGVVVGA